MITAQIVFIGKETIETQLTADIVLTIILTIILPNDKGVVGTRSGKKSYISKSNSRRLSKPSADLYFYPFTAV